MPIKLVFRIDPFDRKGDPFCQLNRFVVHCKTINSTVWIRSALNFNVRSAHSFPSFFFRGGKRMERNLIFVLFYKARSCTIYRVISFVV